MNITVKSYFFMAFACVFTQVYASNTVDINSEMISFNQFQDEIYDNNIDRKNYIHYLDKIKLAQPIFDQIKDQLNFNDQEQLIFLNNYTTLLSNYAEFLDKQHCFSHSAPYWQQSEQVYLNEKLFNSQEFTYNHGLNYARQSVFYRKNTDPTLRLQLLQKAEKIFFDLKNRYPQKQKYHNEYLNVLSDQIDIFQSQANHYEQQKVMFQQLRPTYFKILNHQQEDIDSGNTLIFIQQYFRYLYSENPKQAEQWLKQQYHFIKQFNQQQDHFSQREIEFLAGYYALNRQAQLAINLLKQLDAGDQDAITPEQLKIDPIFANIRFSPEFQLWLLKYEQQFKQQVKTGCQLDI